MSLVAKFVAMDVILLVDLLLAGIIAGKHHRRNRGTS